MLVQKETLYKHLRIFVNEGGTVIFLSSELEEFIGLMSSSFSF